MYTPFTRGWELGAEADGFCVAQVSGFREGRTLMSSLAMAQTIQAIRLELQTLNKWDAMFKPHDTLYKIGVECRRIRREELLVKMQNLVARN